MIKLFISILLLVNILNAKEYFYFHEKRIELKPYRKIASSPRIRYFTDKKGDIFIIKKQIMVRLNSMAVISTLILDYELDIVKKYSNKKYLLEVKNIADVFRIVNAINEKNAVRAAYPMHLNKSRNDRAKNTKKNMLKNEKPKQAKKSTANSPMGGAARTESISQAFK